MATYLFLCLQWRMTAIISIIVLFKLFLSLYDKVSNFPVDSELSLVLLGCFGYHMVPGIREGNHSR